MTLQPCQLVTNYNNKIISVKKYIIEKVDSYLNPYYDPESLDFTVDFGTVTVNNKVYDGLTNKIIIVFGNSYFSRATCSCGST